VRLRTVLRAQQSGQLPVDFSAADCRVEPKGTATRIYLGSDGVMVPMVTEGEKKTRRQTIKQKRQRRGKKARPLPRRKRGADQHYKEFKIVALYDETQEHRLVSGTRGDCEAAGRLMRREASRIGFDRAHLRFRAWRSWFVAERSEALAGAMLTSRSDVHVRSEQKRENSHDFLVEIQTGDALSTQLFVVQVKGTTSSDPNDWTQNVKHLFRGTGSPIYLPVCVFVVNVRQNVASYAWVAEPQVEAKGATLRFHESGTFQPLDSAAVSGIIDRVTAWYHVLPRQLLPA
jgi:hypothetical protein